MNKLCTVLSGSHLYGLNTELSDRDYRGVFLPTLKECVLQQVPKAITYSTSDKNLKNTKDDEDVQFFSLHHFIKLLNKGEIVCFDLLHARGDCLLSTSKEWEYLYDNRQKFYSKRLNGFLGFILSQTRKYSNRGVRYNSVSEVIKFLEEIPRENRLETVWNKLPQNKFSNYSLDSLGNSVYSVCERMVHPSVTVEHALKVFTGYKAMYGNRSVLASKRDGYDLKAISHAFRCLDELDQLISERDIIFPLKNRERILNIKLGKEIACDELFEEMDERVKILKEKLDKSDLPDSIDVKFWEDWLFGIYKNKGF
jgi:hypothetical protein